MNKLEMVKSLTAQRHQIDIALGALNTMGALESGTQHILTPGSGASSTQKAAGSRTHTRKRRIISAEQRAEMSRKATARWAARKSGVKKPTTAVAKKHAPGKPAAVPAKAA